MTDVYIVSAARTPIGSFSGTLSKLKASDLGSVVIQEVLKRGHVEPQHVNEVIMGQALTAGQGQNPARQASLKAGLPIQVPAYGINMLCGSGLKTVVLGYQSIRSGDANVVIAGGQESMSLAPHVMHLRQGLKMGPGTLVDSMMHDGLTDAMENISMGLTAEIIAEKYNLSRDAQDAAAVQSQQRAEEAQQKGYFDKEIVPVEIKDRKGTQIFSKDEYIKAGSTVEGLQKLRAAFKEGGTITAGNASGVNDSAAAVLLMSGEEVAKQGLKPLAKIVGWTQSGIDPRVMGLGPVTAVEALLTKISWKREEVDLYELNEAFAAQSLAVVQDLKLDASKVNVNGGAIALGHPIGASGARVLVTLLYALERTGGRRGIASLCIGGGMGIALAVERVV
ncbi:acetyl-CoA acetyltransferase [Drosophila guanche]|uniref:Blast:Acetyl-CoA acetyltransferase n=1 Tax=Drosophila guanche TaxID=7266 RepID=A0A3B0JRK1_DROGU|nr:acetyl-CoA acetyltransferase [Drosophila guanche]SPP84755.1 blast:Acetyl-CoA acetyltransferase [Drosophila guanche]